MRISDWSSDVCSSDLRPLDMPLHEVGIEAGTNSHYRVNADVSDRLDERGNLLYRLTATGLTEDGQINMTENERLAIAPAVTWRSDRSEAHTSELQSLMRNSYAVFCLKKKTHTQAQSITSN